MAHDSQFLTSRWLFLRALGAIYLIAFASFFTQIDGLIGSHGILPAHELLSVARAAAGWQAVFSLPTLALLGDSDAALKIIAIAGMAASILAMADLAAAAALAVCYLCYLSLVTVGQDFMGFQWDWLLLEVGFLGVFFAQWQWRGLLWNRSLTQSQPSRAVLILLRVLLFKLMFMSGLCKIASGDETWANLTAMDYHYYTQPLPTPLAWFAQKTPQWTHKASVLATFAIELVCPFFVFGRRNWRLAGAIAIVFLQVMILLTGNYTFFNWLTIALCLTLIDDAHWSKVLPRQLLLRLTEEAPVNEPAYKVLANVLALVIVVVLTLGQMVGLPSSPSLFGGLTRFLMRCGIANRYGLFAVMTTSRKEIIVEGSADGNSWLAYEFKFKPGDVKHSPCMVEPLQPRLDWQMWFAALGSVLDSPWFENFILRLLEGRPEVLQLLDKNPFPEKPPLYIRARLYDYHFSDFNELMSQGVWWRREETGEFMSQVSLKNNPR